MIGEHGKIAAVANHIHARLGMPVHQSPTWLDLASTNMQANEFFGRGGVRCWLRHAKE